MDVHPAIVGVIAELGCAPSLFLPYTSDSQAAADDLST
jgi:hypothetical protein